MRYILMMLVASVCSFCSGEFAEDTALWAEIDRINGVLEVTGSLNSVVIEDLFQETVEIVFPYDLANQFEDLRTDAFMSDDYSLLDAYVDRAASAITVLIMGESNAVGVNTHAFLIRSESGSEAFEFFEIAGNGFYVDGEFGGNGTAELPVWMERSGSSAQAVIDPALAEEWLEIWENLQPSLDGYFLHIADETILGLGGNVSAFTEEELEVYYRVYDNPFVMHFRIAIDGYLSGTLEGVLKTDKLLNDLGTYRDYLGDRFVVLMLDPAPMGGYLITAISQQKPDRVFSAWVYMQGNGEYQLRGFEENRNFSLSEIESITDRYEQALRDTAHSI